MLATLCSRCYFVTNNYLGYRSSAIWEPNYKDFALLRQIPLQASFTRGFPRNSVKRAAITAPNCRNTWGPTRVTNVAATPTGSQENWAWKTPQSLKKNRRKKQKNETETKWTKKWTWRSAKRLNWQDWQAARQMPVTTTRLQMWESERERERERGIEIRRGDQRLGASSPSSRVEGFGVVVVVVFGTFFGSLNSLW